jgi:peptidoglycan hydrolase-like protein with peptidoglycan-binding domain
MWLAVGSTGPVVRAVQQEIGTTVDGSFGPQTKAALATWQTQHGLAASGVVDASTWRALLKATAAPSSPSPAAASSNPLSPYVHLVLRRGSRGSAVAALQRRLGVTADGWFGPRTQAAVKRFQVRHHLPVTGVVRARTWRVLGA